MNTLRRAIVASELTALRDSERRIAALIVAERESLYLGEPHTSWVTIAMLKCAASAVQQAERNLNATLDPSDVEHIEIGDAQCSPC